jgi:NADPH-ferrihemoprotein reductase
VNSDIEVERFLRVFSLNGSRNKVIHIKSYDKTIKTPIPSTTTYEAAVRYYLDIGAPISRHFLAVLANFAKDDHTHSELVRLSSDRSAFQQEIACKRLNLALLLSTVCSQGIFGAVPFSLILENVAKLQPRYYSISSSSLVSKKTISITAAVESIKFPFSEFEFKGVATNYLLALKTDFLQNQSSPPTQALPTPLIIRNTHQLTGPRGAFSHPTALLHVRRSKFRLPRHSFTPIIMIGPGTGVAPFRAFVQERALQSRLGREVGRTMLFYGCRRRDEDFLYKEEWQVRKSLGNPPLGLQLIFPNLR